VRPASDAIPRGEAKSVSRSRPCLSLANEIRRCTRVQVSIVRTLISKPRGEAARSLVDSGFSGSPSFGGSDLAPHGKWQVVPVGRAVPSRSRKDESPCDARPRPFRAGRWPTPSASRSRCGTARPIIGGPLESILGDRLSTPTWWRRSRFSSWSAAREWKIEDRFVRSVVREMSISENYEGEITPIRSNISRFSRGTVNLPTPTLRSE
jgi:hypothetical protein